MDEKPFSQPLSDNTKVSHSRALLRHGDYTPGSRASLLARRALILPTVNGRAGGSAHIPQAPSLHRNRSFKTAVGRTHKTVAHCGAMTERSEKSGSVGNRRPASLPSRHVKWSC